MIHTDIKQLRTGVGEVEANDGRGYYGEDWGSLPNRPK